MNNGNRGHNAASKPGEVGFQPTVRPESTRNFDFTDTEPTYSVGFPKQVIVSGTRLGPRGGKGSYTSMSFTEVEEVPMFTSDEAPVSAVVGDKEYRVVDGKTYLQRFDHHGRPVAIGEYKPHENHVYAPREVAFDEDFAQFYTKDDISGPGGVFIDGEFWDERPEPRYIVMTFGLGHNHGGTSLDVDTIHRGVGGNEYRLDEFEEARAYAIEVAENRGDTESVARISKMDPVVTDFDPDLLTLRPARRESIAHRNARFDFQREVSKYVDAVSNDSEPLDEDAAWDRLVQMRAALKAAGGVESPRQN